MGKRHIIAVDWDDTLVEGKWPEMGNWKPGAIDALKRFHREGYIVMVFSVRLSPYWLDGALRPEEDVRKSVQEVRDMLDEAGLPFIGIWQKAGKPPFSRLIDDKAITFPKPGSSRSWERITEKVLVSLGAENPLYEDADWGGAPA